MSANLGTHCLSAAYRSARARLICTVACASVTVRPEEGLLLELRGGLPALPGLAFL